MFLGLLRAIIAHPKPVIAAVDGHVRAGGMGLVAACDLAVAGPSSTFALTEVRLGLAAVMISVPLAARVNSRDLACVLLTGEKFDSAHARRIGLLSDAVEDLDAAVDELAGRADDCRARRPWRRPRRGHRAAVHDARGGRGDERISRTPIALLGDARRVAYAIVTDI
jgi:enoyl-CoA hydratase/carnithine racemase